MQSRMQRYYVRASRCAEGTTVRKRETALLPVQRLQSGKTARNRRRYLPELLIWGDDIRAAVEQMFQSFDINRGERLG